MFRSLVETHGPFIREIAQKAGASPCDIDDVAQITLLFLWRRLARKKPLFDVQRWLSTVARRVAWVHNRSEARWRRRPEGYAPEDNAPDVPDNQAIVELASELSFVQRLAEKLEPDRRVIFLRHDLRGESIPQIAKSLGIPTGTGYSRLHLARADFQRLLRTHTAHEGEKKRAFLLLPWLLEERRSTEGPLPVSHSASDSPSCAQPPSKWRQEATFALLLGLSLLLFDTVLVPLESGPAEEILAGSTPGDRNGAVFKQSEPDPLASALPKSPSVRAPPSVDPPRSTELVVPAERPEIPAQSAPRETSPSPPRPSARPWRSLEAARIQLHAAQRHAMEGRPEAAKQALSGYEAHDPDNPLPSSRKTAERGIANAERAGSESPSGNKP